MRPTSVHTIEHSVEPYEKHLADCPFLGNKAFISIYSELSPELQLLRYIHAHVVSYSLDCGRFDESSQERAPTAMPMSLQFSVRSS